MWPSVFTLGSFRHFAGLLLFSSGLVEISAPLVGRYQEKPVLGKNPSFQENPSLFWEKPVVSLVLVGVRRHFSLFILYHSSGDICAFIRWLLGKTHLGKKTLFGGPRVERKTGDEGPSVLSCSIDGVGRRDDGAARS